MNKSLILILVITFLVSCQKEELNNEQIDQPTALYNALSKLKNYDSLADYEVMVLGTMHFGQDVLESENQESIAQLLKQLKTYQPTKILLEWEPHRFSATNEAYQKYLNNAYDISEKYNEVFQLGFRLGKEMDHDSLYLFDNQTEFIGSLAEFSTEDDPFSFDLFTQYAKKESGGYYDVHEEILVSTYEANQNLMQDLDLKDQIALLNSPENQKINAQRMHMYEVRVGIQKNWSGPDWLGRWYQRNVRMMTNTLMLAEKGDRLLIIVGDNHKWTLDMLFENTPDFRVVSSWDYLNNYHQ